MTSRTFGKFEFVADQHRVRTEFQLVLRMVRSFRRGIGTHRCTVGTIYRTARCTFRRDASHVLTVLIPHFDVALVVIFGPVVVVVVVVVVDVVIAVVVVIVCAQKLFL